LQRSSDHQNAGAIIKEQLVLRGLSKINAGGAKVLPGDFLNLLRQGRCCDVLKPTASATGANSAPGAGTTEAEPAAEAATATASTTTTGAAAAQGTSTCRKHTRNDGSGNRQATTGTARAAATQATATATTTTTTATAATLTATTLTATTDGKITKGHPDHAFEPLHEGIRIDSEGSGE
jgi:hypothetical protein